MMEVGIRVPGSESVDEVASFVAELEGRGFSSAWVPDSQLLWRDVWITLAAAAQSTQRIALGTAVANPVTRHGSVTATAARTVDELAGGRIQVGIGLGGTATSSVGLDPATVRTFEGFVNGLRTFLSQQLALDAIESDTTQRSRIPLLVGASRPRMIRLAGRVADGLIYPGPFTEEAVRGALRLAREAARQAGRNPSRLKCVLAPLTHVGDEPLGELADLGPHVLQSIAKDADHASNAHAAAIGHRTFPDLSHAVDWDHAVLAATDVDQATIATYADEMCLIGTPRDVARRIEAFGSWGVDGVILRGLHPHRLPRELSCTVATDVLPRIGTDDIVPSGHELAEEKPKAAR